MELHPPKIRVPVETLTQTEKGIGNNGERSLGHTAWGSDVDQVDEVQRERMCRSSQTSRRCPRSTSFPGSFGTGSDLQLQRVARFRRGRSSQRGRPDLAGSLAHATWPPASHQRAEARATRTNKDRHGGANHQLYCSVGPPPSVLKPRWERSAQRFKVRAQLSRLPTSLAFIASLREAA